jgi:hypothetical protein
LADQDYDTISHACEGNLSKAFALGLDTLREKKLKLNLLNERNHTWHMEVLDFHNYLGVEIDRKANRAKGIKEFAPFMMDLPNMTIYTPSNPMQAMASLFKQKTKGWPMVVDGMTMEIVVKVRTNYKLDLVDPSSPSTLIPTSKSVDDELHFLRFEGFYPTFEFAPETFMKGPGALDTLQFRDWTIVDFDDYLKGNGHLSG